MRWELVPADGARWRRVLALARHDVYHLPEYAVIEAQRVGGEPVAFVATDGDRVWFVPLLLRPVPGTGRIDATSPYGYPGPLSNADAGEARFFQDALGALGEGLASIGAISCF